MDTKYLREIIDIGEYPNLLRLSVELPEGVCTIQRLAKADGFGMRVVADVACSVADFEALIQGYHGMKANREVARE